MFEHKLRRLARHTAARQAFDLYLRTGRWVGTPGADGRATERDDPGQGSGSAAAFIV